MFSNSSRPVTQADIDKWEKNIGYSLPVDFTTQYLSFNGGVSGKNFYYVADDDGYVAVSFFLPIKYRSNNLGETTIETSYTSLTGKGVAANYIPFAVDWGGNYFALDVKTNDIVLLLMDLGAFTEETVKYLTTGFSNFVSNLEEEDN